MSLVDALARIEKIREDFPRLGALEGREREELGRRIARDIRDHCKTLMCLMEDVHYAKASRKEEASRLSMEARMQALGVYWRARWVLLLLRAQPSLLRDCRRLTKIALQHGDTWIAYLRFLRAQYPEKLGHWTFPGSV